MVNTHRVVGTAPELSGLRQVAGASEVRTIRTGTKPAVTAAPSDASRPGGCHDGTKANGPVVPFQRDVHAVISGLVDRQTGGAHAW